MKLFIIKNDPKLYIVYSLEVNEIYGYDVRKHPIDVEVDVIKKFEVSEIEALWELSSEAIKTLKERLT